MTENKRFHYNWKTGRFKDTQSKSCATSNMRILETQINNACYSYEKKIKKLEKENKELSEQVEYLKKQVKIFKGECNRLTKENTELLEELND